MGPGEPGAASLRLETGRRRGSPSGQLVEASGKPTFRPSSRLADLGPIALFRGLRAICSTPAAAEALERAGLVAI
jgi:hypothetical protein